MFAVFGDLIDPINNKAKHEAVLEWKNSEKTKNCYKSLFKKISANSDDTYMVQILKKIWPEGKATDELVAYTIAVCQVLLDSSQDSLTISESIVKHKLARNLVFIIIIIIIFILFLYY